MIVNQDSALYELFDRDIIVTYKDKQELNEKIIYYLENDEQRVSKATKLQNVVMKKYTYQNEASKFVEMIQKLI